eukprot:CAMPEP_0205930162 /NCGR_PEP_ID=MMETSP1325-20131115/25730_1 /ASSEMBLY_ACC=CAM_ASM_000708 /TAXON_ID=236786 /ORGANISM="Florenciella sp., Strain RCC1007" /LENGTH=57 /DNA_ID=CAMNT_0053299489 /DNA_START=22 /DNA_END=191 /DNA_ORIENTATION=+
MTKYDRTARACPLEEEVRHIEPEGRNHDIKRLALGLIERPRYERQAASEASRWLLGT